MNKEVSDALHMLLHCALKDKEYETQKEQFEIVYKYIEELNNKIDSAIKYLINPPKRIWEGHSIDEVIRILKDSDINE